MKSVSRPFVATRQAGNKQHANSNICSCISPYYRFTQETMSRGGAMPETFRRSARHLSKRFSITAELLAIFLIYLVLFGYSYVFSFYFGVLYISR